MPRYLYLDNYRGFCDTSIPLVDVSFMVGENSTGKTSVLQLLRILSNPSFYLGPTFGSGDDLQFVQFGQFGHFNEVVSAHAEDRSYFRVGFYEWADVKVQTQRLPPQGMLVTFCNVSGVPRLHRLTYSQGSQEIHLRFDSDSVYFRHDSNSSTSPGPAPLLLHKWKNDHASEASDWKQIDIEKLQIAQMPIYMWIHLVAQKSGIKGGMTFPLFLGSPNSQLVWVAPIRTKPRRTYDEPNTPFSPEGSHTPYVIRRMLTGAGESKFVTFMKRVGKDSGLFEGITIKRFGDTDDAPFEIDVILDKMPLNLSWVGYGVSQSLPIYVELLDRPEGSWFAIQQPEVHLHPKAQAALGDLFFEMAQDHKKFVIETHSDFTIDRFRSNYRKKKSKKGNDPSSQVLFFERRDNFNTVTPLTIGEHGELPADQPPGYRDFFVNEAVKLLDV